MLGNCCIQGHNAIERPRESSGSVWGGGHARTFPFSPHPTPLLSQVVKHFARLCPERCPLPVESVSTEKGRGVEPLSGRQKQSPAVVSMESSPQSPNQSSQGSGQSILPLWTSHLMNVLVGVQRSIKALGLWLSPVIMKTLSRGRWEWGEPEESAGIRALCTLLN